MTLICDMHGPMKYRPPLGWWECLGFDGERSRDCGVMLIYDEDLRRKGDIPGVTVAP